jgi:hypothetical protein
MTYIVRPGALVTALAGAGAALGAAIIALFAVSAEWHRPVDSSTSAVQVGHVVYEEVQSRPLYPSDSVDAHLLAGLPQAARRTAPDQLLFGAFIQLSSAGSVRARTAGRIDLRDALNRTYRPVTLPSSNPFAYRVRDVRGTIPRLDSAPGANLAAGGYLMVFRIPRTSYDAGPLELVVHPAGGGPGRSLIL